MNNNQYPQGVVSPRIYTYKITFEDVPFYYYGAHKEKVFNEEYYGTPHTHKWCWEMYQPKKQILEVFDYTDEGWIDALNVEKRLIRPVYNSDPYCLNESCGGMVSLSIARNNGKRAGNVYGPLCYEKKVGVFALTKEQRIENGKRGGSISGRLTKERGTGIFSITKEQQKENGKRGVDVRRKKGNLLQECSNAGKIGGKVTSSQRWRCLVTGHISNAASLARYQKARGIDTTMRERLS